MIGILGDQGLLAAVAATDTVPKERQFPLTSEFLEMFGRCQRAQSYCANDRQPDTAAVSSFLFVC